MFGLSLESSLFEQSKLFPLVRANGSFISDAMYSVGNNKFLNINLACALCQANLEFLSFCSSFAV